MRIYDRNLTGAAGAESERTQETQRSQNTAGGSRSNGAGQAGDRVEFSQTLGRLTQALAHDSTARAAKIQALTASYQSGSYHPDSSAISRAMVSDALGGTSSQ
jgi:flagellar biosynthesis anti-sigma factor FlgM